MPTKLSEKARAMMAEQRGHCAQAILTAYGEQMSSGKVDFDTCMKISSAFSGGIARTGNVCGAINGGLMALGLRYGGSPMEAEVSEAATKLLDGFKAHNGSIICRELIRQDLLTDADVKLAFETGAFRNCPKYVEDVSKILDELL